MFDQCCLLFDFHQKSIMTVSGRQLAICSINVPPFQGPDYLLRLVGRVEPVRLKRNDQKAGVDGLPLWYEFSSRQIKVIYCFCNIEIRIGIEALHKISTAIAQITLHFKISVKSKAELIVLQPPGKFLFHGLIAHEGNVADHPGN